MTETDDPRSPVNLADAERRLKQQPQDLIRKAYEAGWRRGVWLYAIHKDGDLLVGCMQEPYKQVIKKGPPEDYMRMDLEEL